MPPVQYSRVFLGDLYNRAGLWVITLHIGYEALPGFRVCSKNIFRRNTDSRRGHVQGLGHCTSIPSTLFQKLYGVAVRAPEALG